MTPEEIAAKLAELESANAKVADLESRFLALDAKVNPPVADPDEAYKPKTWQELDGKIDRKAEEIALKVLQEAEKKKDEERKSQEKQLEEQNERIEKAFKKLEDDKVIEPTSDKGDVGGKQRAQILGALVRSGGMHVEEEARKLRTAWDAGMEYDYESNSFRKSGSSASPLRDQYVGSSAGRATSPSEVGKVNLSGTRGDLDEVQRRWEEANGKA